MSSIRPRFALPVLCAAALICALLASGRPAVPAGARGGTPLPAPVLPLRFEAAGGPARFAARGAGYGFELEAGRASFALGTGERGKRALLRMELLGAAPGAALRGAETARGRSHYLIGSDPNRWRTNVAGYRRVRSAGVYPGIDVDYYGRGGRLEYDFLVAAGADPERIRLRWRGAPLRLDGSGDLVFGLPGGELRQHRPVAYQMVEGARQRVPCEYVLSRQGDGKPDPLHPSSLILHPSEEPDPLHPSSFILHPSEVSFALGAYDRSRPLVIDPVLSYGTYLGGTGGDAAHAVAVDEAGSAYLTGRTDSADFPLKNAVQGASGGRSDAFIAKLDPTGTDLVYCTYIGGGEGDEGTGIALDSSGNAYVAGTTASADFPTRVAFQAARKGTQDAFVLKLNAAGSDILYSTYLGGGGLDEGSAIALDTGRNAYVTGRTFSTDFPVVTPAQTANGGLSDAFVAKVNPAGSALAYSTYLGGAGDDWGVGVALDSAGSAYVAGQTYSRNFPILAPFQVALRGSQDGFVTRVSPLGSALLFSTFLGGTGFDEATAVAVDAARNVYVTGQTSSSDFPTAAPLQAATGGLDDAFACKLSPTGLSLLYGTYLGGGGNDRGSAIAVDSSGAAYVVGETASNNLPAAGDQPRSFGGVQDGFAVKLNAAGSARVYATYLGGADADAAYGLAVDAAGNAVVAGATASTDFPIQDALQPAVRGSFDAFVLRFDGPLAAPITPGNLSARPVSGTEIDLSWKDNSLTETGFKIERKGIGPTREFTVGANVVTYRDTGLEPSTTYVYRVLATNAGGDSDYSAPASATTHGVRSGRLSISPRTLKFGKVRSGSRKQKRIRLKNVAKVPLSGTVGTVAAPFAVLSGGGAFTLGRGQSRTVVVEFAPTEVKASSATLPITSTDPRAARTGVRLKGTGKRP